MVMLKNPDAPASKAQLWLLHILTKTDTRNLNITMADASKRIEELKKHKPEPKHDVIQKPIKPLVEVEFRQGILPQGKIDLDKIQADLISKCSTLAKAKAKNDNVKIDFYEFDCKDCLFGMAGLCNPAWDDSSTISCGGIVESVSYKCLNYEPSKYSNYNDHCVRPKGKQCHRKKIDNRCLECNYRKSFFTMAHNRDAWCHYIPTIEERLKTHQKSLERYLEPNGHDYTEYINREKYQIELLKKLL